MHKWILLLALAAATLAGCKPATPNESADTVEDPTLPSEASIPSQAPGGGLQIGCYTYQANGDTIILEINDLQGGVRGNLLYSFAEKDRNVGTFDGQLDGDRLFLNYTFQSEGTTSTREVAFRLQGNQLREGYGDLNTSGDAFVDRTTLEYSSEMPLTQGDCP